MSEELRIWNEEDYPMLSEWWNGHGFTAVAQKILPPLGVVCGESAAGWLYMDNGGTGVAMMEWLVTNPKIGPIKAARGLCDVVGFLKSEARRMNYGVILTTCRQDSLARMLERNGFQRTDENMIHLLGVF